MSDDVLKTKNSLRCFCARSPLLAVYGIDKKGRVCVHVKVHKQSRIYGEVFVTSGDISIRCRDCYRWHRIVIQGPKARLEELKSPVVENEE